MNKYTCVTFSTHYKSAPPINPTHVNCVGFVAVRSRLKPLYGYQPIRGTLSGRNVRSQQQMTGTGKTRNEEMEMGNGGNGKLEMKKMGIFLHNCIACHLCIQQHLLERTSATGDSGEEVEHMHQLNTQKSIIEQWLCD